MKLDAWIQNLFPRCANIDICETEEQVFGKWNGKIFRSYNVLAGTSSTLVPLLFKKMSFPPQKGEHISGKFHWIHVFPNIDDTYPCSYSGATWHKRFLTNDAAGYSQQSEQTTASFTPFLIYFHFHSWKTVTNLPAAVRYSVLYFRVHNWFLFGFGSSILL